MGSLEVPCRTLQRVAISPSSVSGLRPKKSSPLSRYWRGSDSSAFPNVGKGTLIGLFPPFYSSFHLGRLAGYNLDWPATLRCFSKYVVWIGLQPCMSRCRDREKDPPVSVGWHQVWVLWFFECTGPLNFTRLTSCFLWDLCSFVPFEKLFFVFSARF